MKFRFIRKVLPVSWHVSSTGCELVSRLTMQYPSLFVVLSLLILVCSTANVIPDSNMTTIMGLP